MSVCASSSVPWLVCGSGISRLCSLASGKIVLLHEMSLSLVIRQACNSITSLNAYAIFDFDI